MCWRGQLKHKELYGCKFLKLLHVLKKLRHTEPHMEISEFIDLK